MKDIKFLLYILIFILPIILSSQSLQYQYDNLSRLTSVDYGNGTIISYTYDDVGNRLTHIFQSAYHPPNPFVLYLPENGEQGVSTTPQFVWGVATDDDPVDIVLYNLNISEDSTLAQVDYLYEELTDTTFLMPEELNDNTKYFWRVDAVDSYNLVTSSDVWSFTTIQYDFDISGNIGYCFNGTPVPDVTVDLTGDNNYSTPTTESGDYFLVGIPGGNYISTPSKADDLGGLSGTDASRIARYVALLYEFDCIEMITADVSLNGNISGTDASRVARYVALLITELNTDSIDWVFTPEPIPDCEDWPPIVYENTREYTPLESNLTDEDFIGIRLGDVSGNWSPDARMPLTQKSSQATNIEASINSTLRIPVVMESVTAIEGVDIEITFNPEVLQLTELSLNKGILDNKNYAIETNFNEAGKGIMVIYALSELVSESGVVAFIEFDVIGKSGSKSDVYFTKFDLNEAAASGGLQLVDSEGKEVTTKRLEANVVETLPEKFALYQNYPNPFNTNTLIKYDLPQDAQVSIQIYNIKGQLVEELVNGIEPAGRKQIEWNTEGMSSGIYFYKLSTKDKTFIKKMLLLH